MKPTTLRVTSVTVKDVLGAREFAIEPGQINTLQGKNGSGKSTALEAIQSALGGGNLAKIARVGGKGEKVEPEVVLVLEGPGTETYRVERKADKVRVRQRVGDTAAFEDVGKPQTWLRSLYDPTGANPVTFLTAKDDARATLVLEALTLPYDRAELLRVMGVTTDELPHIPAGLHPLEEISLIREGVFRTRTGVNRDEKSAESAAEQLRRNIPAEIPEDPGEDAVVTLEGEAVALAGELARDDKAADAAEAAAMTDARTRYAEIETRISTDFKAAAAKLRADHETKAAEIRAEAERRIAAYLAEVETAIDDKRTKGEREIGEAAAARDDVIAAAAQERGRSRVALADRRAVLATKREELAALRARREETAKVRALHDQARAFDAQAEDLATKAQRLTDAIEALDDYRRRLAKDLPIPGLEVEGKAVRVNGVPYEQLNTAQRVDIAVQVAVLRAKGQRLPVVFVDGAEALDTEHFGVLVERLQAAGVQAFIGRVDDSDLRVVKRGEATA